MLRVEVAPDMLALAALYLITGALLALVLSKLLPASPRRRAQRGEGVRRLFLLGAVLAYLLPAIAFLVTRAAPQTLPANWVPALLFLLPGGIALTVLVLLVAKNLRLPMGNDSGQGASSSTMGMDDTRWKEDSERQNAVAELTAWVAHGVRNPLASIRAAAQIAREVCREPEVSEILLSILRESDRLETRIRHLVEFSKPVKTQQSNVDLQEIFQAIVEAATRQATEQNVILDQSCPASLATFCCDAEAIENVLFELVTNGLAAMPEGGRLLLSAERGQGTRILRVSDTGSGIPPGVQGRIFDLFFTTRPEATGIGLATVRKVIRGLGGEVRLEASAPGSSVFSIELPEHGRTNDPRGS